MMKRFFRDNNDFRRTKMTFGAGDYNDYCWTKLTFGILNDIGGPK